MNHNKVAKIIILAGQSNAVGVGYQKYLPKHFPDSMVKRFMSGYKNILINFYSHDFSSGNFTEVKTGQAELTKETFGPEVGIAEQISEDFPDGKFYIVKFAIGGTSLKHDWLSPKSRTKELVAEKGKKQTGYCFDEFVLLLKNSIQILENSGYHPEIRAFCWMQGESDAEELNDVLFYKQRFDNLINDFENIFKQYLKNYILADAGVSTAWKYYKEMNEIKNSYAKLGERRIYIDTIGEGLTTNKEPIEEPNIPHYDSDSVIKLGMLFEKAIKSNLK